MSGHSYLMSRQRMAKGRGLVLHREFYVAT